MEESESVEKLVTKDAEPLTENIENIQPNFQNESGQEQICKGETTTEKNKNNKEEEKEIDTSMKCNVIEIKINEIEKEYETAEEIIIPVKNSNPRITISEPVNSPCESENDLVGVVGGAGEVEGKPSPEPKGRCPIYYGIKSYIHDFYYPPDKEVLKSGEYIQEDDFQYLVDPGGSGERRRGWGRGRWWFRAGLWAGVNLMLVGVIALAVGHLTPPRPPVVGQRGDLTVLDRWAVTFNNRLLFCQMAGLAGFTSGAVIVILVLLLNTYQQEQSPAYCVMAATVVPETFVGSPIAGPKQGWTHRIPLTGSVRGVQPTLTLSRER